MTKPTIHLNGSSADSLFKGYADAAGAIRAALTALCAAAPHGRDYYVQEPGAFEKAALEHQARIKKLRDVLVDLQDLAEHVADQRDARNARRG